MKTKAIAIEVPIFENIIYSTEVLALLFMIINLNINIGHSLI